MSIFGPNPQLCVRKAGHWVSTKCKWVYSMNSPFIANLGHPLWGSQSMQELAPGMRNVLPFLIRDAKSCIDCQPHKGWPRFAMNGIFIEYTHLHLVLTQWPAFLTHSCGFGPKIDIHFQKWSYITKNLGQVVHLNNILQNGTLFCYSLCKFELSQFLTFWVIHDEK